MVPKYMLTTQIEQGHPQMFCLLRSLYNDGYSDQGTGLLFHTGSAYCFLTHLISRISFL